MIPVAFTDSMGHGAAMHFANIIAASAAGLAIAAAPAVADTSAPVTLDGSYSTAFTKPDWDGYCPSGVADQCGTIDLAGLGTADWAYVWGPTFQPHDRCFDVDGTLAIKLHSDGSTTSGPLSGSYCPRPSPQGHERAGSISYGNPLEEDDLVAFAGGTGQFAGVSGVARFHLFFAGARFTVTLNGVLGAEPAS